MRNGLSRWVLRVQQRTFVRIPYNMCSLEKKLCGSQKAKRTGHRCPARFAMQDPP
jgi:hypothetical protein